MNKKKACIESLAALEPNIKIRKEDDTDSEKTDTDPTPAAASTDDTKLSKSDSISTSTNCENEQDVKKCMNPRIFDDDVVKALHQAYSSMASYKEDQDGMELQVYPFRHCILPDFLSDNAFISQLEKELKNVKLKRKNNDLYKFRQSSDLNHSKSSTIHKIRSQLQLMKDFLSSVTDIPLNSTIDLFCSHYRYTDVLLCHDDELEGRRIAFIYYLVPETWNSSDGGALDLFDTDDYGQPKSVVKSILPKRNSFVFFEVSSKSFHQVAEILSEDKTRLSLSGWFHGPPFHRPPPHVEKLSPALPYGNIDEGTFYSWINTTYLISETQSEIRKRFEEDSFIMLSNFLGVEKFKELSSALCSSDIDWNHVGPANKSNTLSADKDSLPSIVKEYLRVIHSDAFFLVLSHLTGLNLHHMATNHEKSGINGESSSGSSVNGNASNPRCRSIVQKLQHGSYTLAHDTDPEVFEFSLDTMLYLGCGTDWDSKNGGGTSYIGKGDDEVLLTMEPEDNFLALVYRDKDCMRFLKHMNHRVTQLPSPGFYEINCVYYE